MLNYQQKLYKAYEFAVALSEFVFRRKFGTKALKSLMHLYISTLSPILYLDEMIIFFTARCESKCFHTNQPNC